MPISPTQGPGAGCSPGPPRGAASRCSQGLRSNPQPPVYLTSIPADPAPSSLEAEVEASPSMAVDTHCHPFLMEEEPGAIAARAREAGVGRLVCVGIDPESSQASLAMAESLPGVFATAGVHPHSASAFDRRAGAIVEELLAHPLVVGVGETGLDYYRRLSPPGDQRRAFRDHIALSRETGKSLVVHIRDAWEDAFAILSAEGADRVVLHCFTGDEAAANEAAVRGYFTSFAGNLTYPGAETIRRAAAVADGSRMLLETDSPFLPPQTHRGAPNHPANIIETASVLADIRSMNLDQMLRVTTAAARSAFPLIV
ncbi:MAG: TatD family deoxyribonuclease [Actinobacteria bacterium]|nr:MAG: TatD family deoxyribonuclease [Actinomycetota bacterium]